MRGALHVKDKFFGLIRIIPADAGSTEGHALKCDWPGDHPRGCGEHGMPALAFESQLGSSPRMRGAQTAGQIILSDPRIIPADAGSTFSELRPYS